MVTNDIAIRPAKQQITIKGTNVTYYSPKSSDLHHHHVRRVLPSFCLLLADTRSISVTLLDLQTYLRILLAETPQNVTNQDARSVASSSSLKTLFFALPLRRIFVTCLTCHSPHDQPGFKFSQNAQTCDAPTLTLNKGLDRPRN